MPEGSPTGFPYDELQPPAPVGVPLSKVCDWYQRTFTTATNQRTKGPFLKPAVVCWRKWGSWLSGAASPARPALVCWGRLTLKLNSRSAGPTFNTDTSEDTHRSTHGALLRCLKIKQQLIRASHRMCVRACARATVMHSAAWGRTTLSFLSRRKLDPEST